MVEVCYNVGLVWDSSGGNRQTNQMKQTLYSIWIACQIKLLDFLASWSNLSRAFVVDGDRIRHDAQGRCTAGPELTLSGRPSAHHQRICRSKRNERALSMFAIVDLSPCTGIEVL